jgi:hypothetical protein
MGRIPDGCLSYANTDCSDYTSLYHPLSYEGGENHARRCHYASCSSLAGEKWQKH